MESCDKIVNAAWRGRSEGTVRTLIWWTSCCDILASVYTIGCSPPGKGRQNQSIATLMLTHVGILGNNAGTEKGRM